MLLKRGALKAPSGPFEPSMSILLTQAPERAHADARRVMAEALGLRLISKDGEWTVMEKGIPPRVFHVLFPAALLTLFSGALITLLFAFEGTITLRSGSPMEFMPENRGLIRPFWKSETGSVGLLFESSISEYVQTASLDYPPDIKSRLAIKLGFQRPAIEAGEDALASIGTKAHLKVRSDNGVTEGGAGTEGPFRYGAYAFRLIDIERTLRLRIDGSPIPLSVKTGGEAIIPGSLSTLEFGQFRKGSVTRLDGTRQDLRPHVAVRKKGAPGEPALLRLGEPVIVDGALVSLADVRETAVLRYRYDPGKAVVLAGGLLAVISIVLKLFGPYYLLAYRIDASVEIARIDLHASSGGAFSSKARLLHRIERLLTKDDLRPEALPG